MSYHSRTLREIGLILKNNVENKEILYSMFECILSNTADHIDELERRVGSDTILKARYWDEYYNNIKVK